MFEKIKTKISGRLSLIIPYFICASLFIIFPTIMLLIKAFTPVEESTFFTVLENKTIWNILGRSIWLALLASIFSLFLAFPFSWIVARSKSYMFRILSLALILSPLVIFSIAKIFSLKILLLRIFDSGRVIPLVPGVQWIMILGMVYLYLPFMIIPLYSILQSMPESLLEASKDLGFNSTKSVCKIAIPYALKGIFSGLAIVFMLSATSLIISNTLVPAATGHGIADINYVLIGNFLDTQTLAMTTSSLAAQQGSTIALITIIVLMFIYGLIYFIPYLIRKIRGGIHA